MMKVSRKELFKSRFLKHYPRLCSIAYGYVSDRADSEDIVQELFVSVAMSTRKYNKTFSLEPYT